MVLPSASAAVAASDKIWPTGSVLRVDFLNGTESQKEYTMEIAAEFSKHGNISFERITSGASDIRVEFTSRESNSRVGTDANTVVDNAHTMRLAFPTNAARDEILEGIILHEFGHALGLRHEHQNPQIVLCWNESAVFQHFRSIGWPDERIRSQILTPLDRDTTTFTDFDPNSIMLYFFPANLFTCGLDFRNSNALSSVDKTFIGELYPAVATTSPPSNTEMPSVTASTSSGGCQYIAASNHQFDPTLPLSLFFSFLYLFRRKIRSFLV